MKMVAFLLHLCHIPSSIKLGSLQQCNLLLYSFKHWTNIQPHIAWWKFELSPHFFVLHGIHITLNYVPSKGQCSP